MGHDLTALIGAPAVLDRIAAEIGAPAPTALPFDLAIIPLGHKQVDRLTGAAAFNHRDGFIYLSAELENGIAAAARDARLLYLETEYFGGSGYQGAVLFERGRPIWQDRLGVGETPDGRTPINEGLSRIGVVPAAGSDEFDGVGLGRFRHMEDFGLVDDDDGD